MPHALLYFHFVDASFSEDGIPRLRYTYVDVTADTGQSEQWWEDITPSPR